MKKIIALALCAAMCIPFAACGGEAEGTIEVIESTEATTEAVTEKAEPLAPVSDLAGTATEVEKLLSSLKAGDVDTIVAISGSDAILSDALLMEMLTGMFSKLEYTVGTPVDNGDGTASVPVNVSAVSINSLFTEYMMEAAKHVDDESWDEDGSYFIELCTSDKVAKDTKDVTVNFEKVDGMWVRSESEEFVNALFGGILG